MKKIELRVGTSQTSVLDSQCDIVEIHDTLKEAKIRAKYFVSGDYERYMGADASEPMRYAQVMLNGECLYDYFKKGYNGQKLNDLGEIITN